VLAGTGGHLTGIACVAPHSIFPKTWYLQS